MPDLTPAQQAIYRRLDAGLPLSVGETKGIFQSLTGCVWSDDKRCEACNAEGRQMIGGVNRHEFACVACKGKGYVPRKAEPATMSVNPSSPFAEAVEENNRLRLEVGVLREKLADAIRSAALLAASDEDMKPSDKLLAELEAGVERCKQAVDAYNKSDGNDRLWHRVQFASFALSDTVKEAINAGLLTHYRELRAKEATLAGGVRG